MLDRQWQELPLLPLNSADSPDESEDDFDENDQFDLAVTPLSFSSTPSAFFFYICVVPLLVSVPGHCYFGMLSTLHVYLGFLFVGFPALSFILLAARSAHLTFAQRYIIHITTLLVTLALIISATTSESPSSRHTQSWSLAARNDTVFLAANLYSSEHLFPAFSRNLLEIAQHLGEENVYISIFESNSQDGTKHRLELLRHQLVARGIAHRIRMQTDTLREDLERIERLALVRNEALKPLDEGIHGLGNRTFSRIVWLNDIFFRPASLLELLSTNKGHFDQVCALDYFPLGFYDTWVTRDMVGDRLKPLWPYFKRSDDIWRLRRGDPIAVRSCWNGMTVFDAKWFLPANLAHIDSVKPPVKPPIRFRTHPNCNVSECLLFSYDIHTSSTQSPLIFVNPRAVATYQFNDYLMYDWLMRTNLVVPWRLFWQDFVSNVVFGFLTDIGRKLDDCADALRGGWKS